MLFISSSKFFLFLRSLDCYPDVFGDVRKRLDKKAKVNFKTYDVRNWITNNYNKHCQISLKTKAMSLFLFLKRLYMR